MIDIMFASASTTMDSTAVASLSSSFISSFTTVLTDNLGIVLTFAGGILVWAVLKKWIFGGARRV